MTGGRAASGAPSPNAWPRTAAPSWRSTYHSDRDSAQDAAAAIEKSGAAAIPIQARLEEADGAAALFAALDAELTGRTGRTELDILVNNAGTAGPATLADADPATFDRLVAVNSRAPFFVTQAAARRLRAGGRVINISSVYSTRPAAQAPVYSMTKAAVDVLTQTKRGRTRKRGITVNAVAPGWTATDANNAALRTDDAMVAGVARDTVAGRMAKPADVAGVVSLFAAPEAALAHRPVRAGQRPLPLQLTGPGGPPGPGAAQPVVSAAGPTWAFRPAAPTAGGAGEGSPAPPRH